MTSAQANSHAEQRPRSAWSVTWRTALHQPRTRVGLALSGFVVGLALLGPLFSSGDPNEFVGAPFIGPTGQALLGTDFLGQDVMQRLLHGGRTLLWMSLTATLLGVLIGLAIGMIAGYSGRRVEGSLMWFMDVILAFPQIVLAIVFVSMLGPLPWLIVLVVALTHIPRVARLTRSLTADCVRQEFIEAAKTIATPRSRILIREVLPNLTTQLAVETTIRLAWSVSIIAALSFVGYGVQPPFPDWGLMINENRIGLVVQPWSVLAPVFLVAMLAVGVSLVGDGIARAASGVDERVSQ